MGSAMNSASTPGGYGTQPSPYFPQYGGPPGPMTPQGNLLCLVPVTGSNLLQVQVQVLVLPGRLLSNTHPTAVKVCLVRVCLVKVCLVKDCLDRECLDRECLRKECLDKECLVMVFLARAMARCQEVQVGMAVDKRLRLVDGIKVSLKATATDTRATRARQLELLGRQIH